MKQMRHTREIKQRNHLMTILSTLAGLCFLVIASFIYWAGYWPAKVEQVKIHSRLYTGTINNKKNITIMSYNVKYMQSNENNYYFNGENNDTWLTQDTIIATINNIAKIIDDSNPDIILLQKVDISSKRTFKINQIKALLNKISGEYQYWACTPYWKNKYNPSEEIRGKIDMQLCTVSKYPIKSATRYALPNIDKNSFLTYQFMPKRAILATNILINNHNYNIYNLHLSPYAQHDKSENPQLKILENIINENKSTPYIVGGDFNMLADKKMLVYIPQNEQQAYLQEDKSFKSFFTNYQAVPSLSDLLGVNAKQFFTYMGNTFSDSPPDRTIDYFFLPKNLKVIKYEVLQNDLSRILSDHLPLLVTIEVE